TLIAFFLSGEADSEPRLERCPSRPASEGRRAAQRPRRERPPSSSRQARRRPGWSLLQNLTEHGAQDGTTRRRVQRLADLTQRLDQPGSAAFVCCGAACKSQG